MDQALIFEGGCSQYVIMCMGNGEWEPDPREVECIGM